MIACSRCGSRRRSQLDSISGLGDMALVDGENFDLAVARQDNFTSNSADQSPRDG